MVSRTPPTSVQRELRREVGFCCPVLNCGDPYLTWHHFDPQWHVEHHHRPEGMIALCLQHAYKADGGAFTKNQLRELKRVGKERAKSVHGRFDWMRRDLLAVVGGNFCYEPSVILKIGKRPCIWFDRDQDHNLLLNFQMPAVEGRPGAQIVDNNWRVTPEVDEVITRPYGRALEVHYHNGDRFRAEFFDVESADELARRYPRSNTQIWASSVPFPITAVELWETASGAGIEFGPGYSRIGDVFVGSAFLDRILTAYQVRMSDEDVALLFPDPE